MKEFLRPSYWLLVYFGPNADKCPRDWIHLTNCYGPVIQLAATSFALEHEGVYAVHAFIQDDSTSEIAWSHGFSYAIGPGGVFGPYPVEEPEPSGLDGDGILKRENFTR